MDYVDLYILHRWDNVTPIKETMEILNDLVKSKKVRAIGVSNCFAWQIARARNCQKQWMGNFPINSRTLQSYF